MTFYDDDETSCPYCSLGMAAADLCEHEDPMCARCCVVNKHEAKAQADWWRKGMVA